MHCELSPTDLFTEHSCAFQTCRSDTPGPTGRRGEPTSACKQSRLHWQIHLIDGSIISFVLIRFWLISQICQHDGHFKGSYGLNLLEQWQFHRLLRYNVTWAHFVCDSQDQTCVNTAAWQQLIIKNASSRWAMKWKTEAAETVECRSKSINSEGNREYCVFMMTKSYCFIKLLNLSIQENDYVWLNV